MLTIVFRTILSVLHCAYDLFETTKNRLTLLLCFLSRIYWRLCVGNEYNVQYDKCQAEFDRITLRDSAERIKKLPVHLCIVVAGCDERASFHHLARLLRWCVDVKIPHVSFYDHDGFLKQNQNALTEEWEKANPELRRLVSWQFGASATKNFHNGFQRPTRVRIFSNDDGRGEIVTLARNLSRAVTHGLVKMEEITTELLDDKLRLENTPDPDVAVVCGGALSTYGLLPWHTRTTEFFNVRSHRDVTTKDFIFILEKFGRCQQRYGK